MSSWVTANGTPEQSTSNLQHEALKGQSHSQVGGRSIEVQTPFDGGASKLVASENTEYTAGKDLGFQGSVIGSARSEGGSLIVNRQVTAKDQVTLPEGATTSVAVAAQLGYLTRNPDGSFSDATPATTLKNPAEAYTPPAPKVESQDAPAPFTISDEGEAAISEVAKGTTPGDQIKAIDEILQLGGVSENTLARMASTMGEEPALVAERVNAIHQGFHDAATAHLSANGVTNEAAFEAFIGDNPKLAEKVTEGARALVMAHDPTALTDVASTFLEQADRYMPEDVTAALDEVGLSYERAADGRLLVKVEGHQVPWNVGVRQGIIKFL